MCQLSCRFIKIIHLKLKFPFKRLDPFIASVIHGPRLRPNLAWMISQLQFCSRRGDYHHPHIIARRCDAYVMTTNTMTATKQSTTSSYLSHKNMGFIKYQPKYRCVDPVYVYLFCWRNKCEVDSPERSNK